jgi:hypothetical protein
MLHRVKSIALALALVGVGAVLGGGTALAVQGHMLAAKGDLQAAANELNAAVPDKAGHRVKALDLVNRAINQTNMGIRAGAM